MSGAACRLAPIVETVDDSNPAMDVAWQQVEAARATGDQRAIARACNVLGCALVADHRPGEAVCLHIEATQAARDSGDDHALSQAADALMGIGPKLDYGYDQPASWLLAEEAYGSAASTFAHLGHVKAASDARNKAEQTRRRLGKNTADRIDDFWNAWDERSKRVSERKPPEMALRVDLSWEVVAAGFVAVKTLGPFLEAFAAKLGDQLGESFPKVISRIKVVRNPRRKSFLGWFGGKQFIEIYVPNGRGATLLELPDELTDEAKLAIIDLDVSADDVRGKRLRWEPASGKWIPWRAS